MKRKIGMNGITRMKRRRRRGGGGEVYTYAAIQKWIASVAHFMLKKSNGEALQFTSFVLFNKVLPQKLLQEQNNKTKKQLRESKIS